MFDIRNSDIRVTRIVKENKLYFGKHLPSEVYYAVENANCYTYAAVFDDREGEVRADKNSDPDVLLPGTDRCAGIVQFISDGTHGAGSIAEIKFFHIVADNRRGKVKTLLMHEMVNICKKSSISTIGLSVSPEDELTGFWFESHGFRFVQRKSVHLFTSFSKITGGDLDFFASKIPASYVRPRVVPLESLNRAQANQLIHKFLETEETSIRNLSVEMLKPKNLAGYVLTVNDDVIGAVFATYKESDSEEGENESYIWYLRYLRIYRKDPYGVLLMCDTLIKEMYEMSAFDSYVYIDTTYRPGISLINYLFPDLAPHSYTSEYGVMKVVK